MGLISESGDEGAVAPCALSAKEEIADLFSGLGDVDAVAPFALGGV
jgi:hypothetical protein